MAHVYRSLSLTHFKQCNSCSELCEAIRVINENAKKSFIISSRFMVEILALEVQMLVRVSVCLSVCQTCYNCTGLLKDFQRTSKGLWTLWSKKFTSLQVAAPRSLRLVDQIFSELWRLQNVCNVDITWFHTLRRVNLWILTLHKNYPQLLNPATQKLCDSQEYGADIYEENSVAHNLLLRI